ncbi:hypothetical protein JCM9279_000207, partial [Rhodotorula babjevae]
LDWHVDGNANIVKG